MTESRNAPLDRIERVLGYIEENLDQPLSVSMLADRSSWSRWQFQRVFKSETGLSVAQYVRELRLSQAAELLLSSQQRQLDIALACGFDSEISFHRAFRQQFDCTPGRYRRRGLRTGLKTPLKRIAPRQTADKSLLQVRLETRAAFEVVGVCGELNGLLAEEPDFHDKVPALWERLSQRLKPQQLTNCDAIGVVDASCSLDNDFRILYWACLKPESSLTLDRLHRLSVPEQQYAVIPHRGPISGLSQTLEWFLREWLPNSGYIGVNGFELECYGRNYDMFSSDAYMEYWVPVRSGEFDPELLMR